MSETPWTPPQDRIYVEARPWLFGLWRARLIGHGPVRVTGGRSRWGRTCWSAAEKARRVAVEQMPRLAESEMEVTVHWKCRS